MEERRDPVSLRFLLRGWITRTPIAHRGSHNKHRNTETAAFFYLREHPLGIARYAGASCSAALALCQRTIPIRIWLGIAANELAATLAAEAVTLAAAEQRATAADRRANEAEARWRDREAE